MQKAFVAASVLVILHLGWGQILDHTPIRLRRDADHSSEEVTHIVVKIQESVTHLRHAEARIKTFIERVEEGLKNSTVVKALHAAHDRFEKGELDLSRIAALNITSHNDHLPKTFRDLVIRISEDTHILLDQLHGHMDSLGHHTQQESDEDSFEDDHKKKSS